MSPFIGWFLLVSAYTKRSPLLMAFMPLILIGLLEGIIFRSHCLCRKRARSWRRLAAIPNGGYRELSLMKINGV